MLVSIVRALFIVIATGFLARIYLVLSPAGKAPSILLFVAIVLMAVGVVVIDWLTPRKKIQTISAVYFGLVVGLILSNLLQAAIEPTLETLGSTPETNIRPYLVGLLTVTVCFACVSLLLQTKEDFRFIIPYMEFSKEVKGTRPLVLDTSVIIDGRIADVTESKVLDQPMIVPRFVLQELQTIADSPDKLRRNRGRRGLDILSRLQKQPEVEVRIHDGDIPELAGVQGVDQRLVVLAKHLGGKVVTNDYNLNKIAKLQGVEVINLNDLANALKPIVLPGEGLTVKLIKRGEEPGQGVGYLDDGTMVVVEQGVHHLGELVRMVVTSVLQTSAGRMIFGRLDSGLGPGGSGSSRGSSGLSGDVLQRPGGGSSGASEPRSPRDS
jgi:uncharacterized protein YacL